MEVDVVWITSIGIHMWESGIRFHCFGEEVFLEADYWDYEFILLGPWVRCSRLVLLLWCCF